MHQRDARIAATGRDLVGPEGLCAVGARLTRLLSAMSPLLKGITPSLIVGSSMGAIISAIYSQLRDSSKVEELVKEMLQRDCITDMLKYSTETMSSDCSG